MDTNIGMNIFCGPAVLSIFTGLDTDSCAEEISKVNGKHTIKGVYPQDLIEAGMAMGLDFTEIPSFESRSIFWAGSVLIKMAPAMYLVTIPKHYIALEVRDKTIYICDNHTKTEIELQNSARLSQKIERVWKVIRVREYSKPHVVHTQYHAEMIGGSTYIKRVDKLSDDGVKIHPLGSFSVTSPTVLQEIAFEIMKLTGKE